MKGLPGCKWGRTDSVLASYPGPSHSERKAWYPLFAQARLGLCKTPDCPLELSYHHAIMKITLNHASQVRKW